MHFCCCVWTSTKIFLVHYKKKKANIERRDLKLKKLPILISFEISVVIIFWELSRCQKLLTVSAPSPIANPFSITNQLERQKENLKFIRKSIKLTTTPLRIKAIKIVKNLIPSLDTKVHILRNIQSKYMTLKCLLFIPMKLDLVFHFLRIR